MHDATTGPPPNEVTCDEVTGAVDLRKVISELVVGQKILAKQIQCQQATLKRQQKAISQLAMG